MSVNEWVSEWVWLWMRVQSADWVWVCFFNMSICKLNTQFDSRKRQREVCHKQAGRQQRHINASSRRREGKREREEKPHTVHKCTKYRSTERERERDSETDFKWGLEKKCSRLRRQFVDTFNWAKVRTIQILRALRGQFLNLFEFN